MIQLKNKSIKLTKEEKRYLRVSYFLFGIGIVAIFIGFYLSMIDGYGNAKTLILMGGFVCFFAAVRLMFMGVLLGSWSKTDRQTK